MANLFLEQYAGTKDSHVDIASYISGYIDGEGCFTVSISPRASMKLGWEVRPSCSVSQNGDRSEVLFEIKQFFGCGTVRPDRSDKTLKWEVRSLPVLLETVIPHFRRYPLRSSKRLDFELFAEICERLERREHLTKAGFQEVAKLAEQMNPSGKRRYFPSAMFQDSLDVKA